VDLPTYTNIWRIEKRLYKLYDFRLPMPLPINWIAVFTGITVPYIVLLVAIGLPFNHTLVWLYVLPPGLLTWLTTRPVIESKRLPELVESQIRYLTEPRVWCRLAPLNEKDQVVVTARVWHSRRAPQRRETAAAAASSGVLALRERGTLARRGSTAVAVGGPGEGNAPLAAATALAATQSTAPVRSRSRSRARGTGGPHVPLPGRPGRQRPAGGKTRAPERSWAAQQHEAAQQTESEQGIWPAQPPSPGQDPETPPVQQSSAMQPGEQPKQEAPGPGRQTWVTGQQSQEAGQEAQAAKPSRFRLSALRSRPAGAPPALPPGVALRTPGERARSRSGGPALPRRGGTAESRTDSPARSGQPAEARPRPEAPLRTGPAWPARWTPAARSAPPSDSAPALVPPDLPAHATPDVYPASTAPGAADTDPAAPVQAAPVQAAPDGWQGTRLPAPADARSGSSTAMPPAPEASTGGAPRVEIAHDGPAQRPAPPAYVPPENSAAARPVPVRPLRPAPQVVPPTAVDSGIQPSATSGGDAPLAPEVELHDRGEFSAIFAENSPRSWTEEDGSPAAEAPGVAETLEVQEIFRPEEAEEAKDTQEPYAAEVVDESEVGRAQAPQPAEGAQLLAEVPLAEGIEPADEAQPVAAVQDPGAVEPSEAVEPRGAVEPSEAVESPGAVEPSEAAEPREAVALPEAVAPVEVLPRVEALAPVQESPSVRALPAEVPPPVQERPSEEVLPTGPREPQTGAPQRPLEALPTAEAPAPAQEPPAEAVPPMRELPVAGPLPRLPVIKAVAPDLAVPSIERALSGPSRDRDLSWHGKAKIVAGGGQGPGKRDQEALDRARARLPLRVPKRVLMLGCTSGAGQTVTTLMTGHILASLREEPVAAVDMHDGALASHSAPAAWLEDVLRGKPPRSGSNARPDGLHPTPKNSAARLDVIASREPLRDGDEVKLAVQLTRHYSLVMLDPGATGLTKLLKVTDQLVIVVPASVDGTDALADTRDWLEAHGFTELTAHSVTVINGVSRRSLPDVEHAESVAHGRCRAIVRVPWDDMLPVGITGPSTLRPQTRVAYTALAGVLVAGLAAAPVRTS